MDINPVLAKRRLVYAWKMLKEICLIFGAAIKKLYTVDSSTHTLFSNEETSLINYLFDYFYDLLIDVKHRGVYEQAYNGYLTFCDAMWRCVCYLHHDIEYFHR